MVCFLFDYKFWVALTPILFVFYANNGFCNAKFSEFVAMWVLVLTKPLKGTSLGDFTRFAPFCLLIRSRVFSLGD